MKGFTWHCTSARNVKTRLLLNLEISLLLWRKSKDWILKAKEMLKKHHFCQSKWNYIWWVSTRRRLAWLLQKQIYLLFKVDGTSFSHAGSLVMTAHLTREICPRDLKYRKSKTNMGAQKSLLTRCFFPVCPRLDQNKSCPLGVSC